MKDQPLKKKVECAIKTNQKRILRMKSKCLKCIKEMVAEEKVRRVESRHRLALKDFKINSLVRCAHELYHPGRRDSVTDQQAFVNDESRMLEYRIYNLAKKYWPEVPPQLAKKYAVNPSALAFRQEKMAKIQTVLPVNQKQAETSRSKANPMSGMTEAMVDLQVSKTTAVAGVGRKRKAEELVEVAKPAKVAKVETVQEEAEKRGWCVVM